MQRSALCRSRRELSWSSLNMYFSYVPSIIFSLQNLASIQPRTSLVKFVRSPRTDPPGLGICPAKRTVSVPYLRYRRYAALILPMHHVGLKAPFTGLSFAVNRLTTQCHLTRVKMWTKIQRELTICIQWTWPAWIAGVAGSFQLS